MNRKIRRADVSRRRAGAERDDRGSEGNAAGAARVVPQPAVKEMFAKALGHHQAGRLNEAEASYRRILALDPRHADSLHLLGVIAYQVGRNDISITLIEQAIGIESGVAAFHSNLGNALMGSGRLNDAVTAYTAAIRITPDFAEAYSNLGNALQELGRLVESVAAYNVALSIKPDFAEVYSNLGSALTALGRFDDAVTACGTALSIISDYAEAHYNLGNALRGLQRLDDAIAAYGAALRINPNYPQALSNLGNTLLDKGLLEDAVAMYAKALRIRPDYAEAYSNLGNALKRLRRLDDAIEAYRNALRIRPDFAEAHYNLGNALRELGNREDAIIAFGAALRVRPDFAEAHANLGSALADMGRLGDAIAAFKTALHIRPDYLVAYSGLTMTMNYLPNFSSSDFLSAAQKFAAGLTPRPAKSRFDNEPDPSRRLRVGYVSGDFKNHPVGYFLASTLEAHDHCQVEVICYSNNDRIDAMTRRLRAASSEWREIAHMPDSAVEAMVVADRIDILIDLAGHTELSRLPLFAGKPAPIQATWLGYFGTTGLEAIDYIIADRFVAPIGEEKYFVEAVWRLPDSYLCFTPPDIECPMVPRLGVSEPLMLGCFNAWAKISEDTIRLWAELLKALPQASLLLKTTALSSDDARQRAHERFASHGVAAERLFLEGGGPRTELLNAYNRVDIALDPFPFGGGTTTAEALWMGVPVVTMRGDRWVGRVSESILTTIGRRDLVADDREDYKRIVLALAGNRTELGLMRGDLRRQMASSAICDGVRFARSLEAAWRQMWLKWCAGRSEERK